MAEKDTQLREIGGNFREFLQGFFGAPAKSEEELLAKTRSPDNITFGQETRKARLYTEITVDGKKFDFEAAGARSCSAQPGAFRQGRDTVVFNLTCALTYFATDDTPLGPVRIVQDPRIVNRGWIYLRRNKNNQFELPALNVFNQHLIFHVGDRYFYYPRAWQVQSAISAWPPEYHQYHHLEEDTPIFDFITREPNVARKGISTISIEGRLTPEEEQQIWADHNREVELIKQLPASKMSPENLTPAQVESPAKQPRSPRKRR
jgi:hypothetical protein